MGHAMVMVFFSNSSPELDTSVVSIKKADKKKYLLIFGYILNKNFKFVTEKNYVFQCRACLFVKNVLINHKSLFNSLTLKTVLTMFLKKAKKFFCAYQQWQFF